MKEERVYSDEFKAQAVEMAMQPGAAKAGVARSPGVNPNSPAGWINSRKIANHENQPTIQNCFATRKASFAPRLYEPGGV